MMSAYLSRLVERFSPPPPDDGSVALQPFIRSRSPIAAIDQRLGIDESLGHGLADASGGLDESTAESPEPMRVQRKAASATATAPTLAAPPPVTRASAANLSAPEPSPMTPAPAAPRAAELGPRREPMDPGPLFAPFARHHDEPASDEPTLTPRAVELRTVETIVERRDAATSPTDSAPAVASKLAAPLAPRPAASVAPKPAPQAEPTLLAADSSSRSESPLSAAPRMQLINPPWVAFDRNIPTLPDLPDQLDAPELQPQTLTTVRTESRVIPLLVEPRRPTPAPFVPEAERTQPAAQTSATRAATTRTSMNVPSMPTPSPRPPSAPTPARGKLDIDSISQIGPLARHFPNRRRFRLRYR